MKLHPENVLSRICIRQLRGRFSTASPVTGWKRTDVGVGLWESRDARCFDELQSAAAKRAQSWRDSRFLKGAMEGQDDQNQDLTLFVQNLLKEMQGRFQTMSDSIINRIDDMGARIDDLEKSISELIQEAGVEGDAAGSTQAAPAVRPS